MLFPPSFRGDARYRTRNDGKIGQCPGWTFFIAASCSGLAVPW